jgi:ribosomal protein S27AE
MAPSSTTPTAASSTVTSHGPWGAPAANADDFWVCGRCFMLHGQRHGRRQLCDCASAADRAVVRAASDSGWTRLQEICRCCAAAVVSASHTFARWFCGECLSRVTEVNKACGTCMIPIGWHSIINGVSISANRSRLLPDLTAAADQLHAFLRESGDTWEWGRQVIEQHWYAAGLPVGGDVPLERYLAAVAALDVDKQAAFDALVSARGVPANWRQFADVPASLIWEESDSGGYRAQEWILWETPPSLRDGCDDDPYTDAPLHLLVRPLPDGTWVWKVILDPAFWAPHRVLASGVQPSAEQAKERCDAHAQRLIAMQQWRCAP